MVSKGTVLFLLFCHGATVSGWLFFSPSEPDPFENDMTKFELYTRLNDDTFSTGTGQAVGKNLKAVTNSNFNASLPTKIFIHGWFGGGWNWYIRDMRRQMLIHEDCNFIEVDWSEESVNINYAEAKLSAQQVGKNTAEFIIWLHDNFGLDYSLVHIIGHSLGGQAAGAAGKYLQNPPIGRISGLDPAQPGFNLTDPSDTLGPEDADFVDVIHTTFVAIKPMGHVDFYPNGGSLGVPALTWIHSHLQAVYIYTESINGHCQFTSYVCESYSKLTNGGCETYCPTARSCNQMGYHASPSGALGSLQLQIREAKPYC
ncbi:pancreatic lipase-related protein 2-like [Watersipora subatra]|uniref:pancreatic lipase-related protein 2-like n=1 Tax=Watersipora subatra TaxID=2589382 RepID=UPI00355B76AD